MSNRSASRKSQGMYKTAQVKLATLLTTTAMTAAGLVAAASPARALDDFATPTGEHVVGGAASFDRPAEGALNVFQNTQRVVINWDSFNIGAKAKTEFFQPNSSSLAVNRVTGAGTDPTQILGSLKANGQLMVLDRNGVFFGRDAQIDVGGIIASTGDVDPAAVMSGADRIEITGAATGAIVNEATINVADAGLAAFVAPSVVNSGVINAKLGKVAFAAGEKVTVDLYGDELIEIALDDKLAAALIENTGAVNAEGGSVLMTANAAKEAVDNAINMSGVVNVASVTRKGGKIVLAGGEGNVNVSGKMDASGATGGGDISVTGRNVGVSASAELKADATDNGDGGNVYMYGGQYAVLEGYASAQGGANGGNGGFIELSAAETVGFNGWVSTYAAAGSLGTFLIDPKFIIIHSGTTSAPSSDPFQFQDNSGSSNDYYYNKTTQYLVSANALANALATNNVRLEADDFIDVGTRNDYTGVDLGGLMTVGDANTLPDGEINLYQGVIITGAPGHGQGAPPPQANNNCNANSTCPAASGFVLTSGDLTLKAGEVNFNRKLNMGKGDITVDANRMSLSDRIYGLIRTTGSNYALQILGDSRLKGVQRLDEFAVLSPNALINQAIAFADSTNDKLITVAAGTYNESVNANKSKLTLQGAAGHGSVISPNSPGFTVTANDVTIDGFTIVDADHGIRIDDAARTTVKNNWFHDLRSGDGINGTDADDLVVTGNVFDMGNDDNGIEVNSFSSNITITANSFTGGNDGVVLDGSGGANIANNFFSGIGDDGVQIEVSGYHTVTVFNNSFSGFGGGRDAVNNNDSLTVNASGNYWGAVTESGVADVVDGSVDFTPFLMLSADTDGNASNGFQGDFSNLFVTALGGQTQSGGRINEAVGLLADGSLTGGSRLIWVGPGTFNENVLVNKSVTLRGNNWGVSGTGTRGAASLVQDTYGSDNSAYAFRITGSDVTIDGFDMNVDGNGVRIEGGSGFDIVNNVIMTLSEDDSNDAGIRSNGASDVLIQNNRIDADNHGIFIDYGSNVEIRGNTIAEADDDGIHMNNVTGTAIIDGNTVDNTDDDGIHVYNTAGVQITTNHVGTTGGYNNIGGDGIYVVESAGAQVNYNHVSDTRGHGIFVQDSDSVDVFGNYVYDTAQHGIFIDPSDDVEVAHNYIDYAGWDGINVDGGDDARIYDNYIYESGYDGIDVNDNDGVRIFSNYVYYSGGDGITVSHSDNARIKFNDIEYSEDDGIDVYNSDGVLIRGNDVDYSDYNGIEVTDSDDVVIKNNNVYDAGGDGIYVDYAYADYNWFGAKIIGNTVDHTGDDGIDVRDSENVFIGWNDIYNAGYGYGYYYGGGDYHGADGISVSGAYGGYYGYAVKIIGNDIDTTHDDGIEVRDSGRTLIKRNDIANTGANSEGGYGGGSDGYGADGISVRDVYGYYGGYSVEVIGNDIENTGDDGIEIDGSRRVLIRGNDIYDIGYGRSGDYGDESGADGIRVSDVYADYYGQYAVEIYNNYVDTTGDDGIEVVNSGRTRIEGNELDNIGARPYYSGYYGYYGDYGYYGEGRGDFFGADGIAVMNVHGDEGYYGYYGGHAVEIVGNNVDTTGDDGIQVLFSGSTLIDTNTISNAGANEGARIFGADGISVIAFGGFSDERKLSVFEDYYGGYEPTRIDIVNNDTVSNSQDDGIEVIGGGLSVFVDYNGVTGSGDNGIALVTLGGFFGEGPFLPEVSLFDEGPSLDLFFLPPFLFGSEGGFDSVVTNNTVEGSGNNGLSVEGPGHGGVLVAGNTMNDNPTGMFFESGDIDLTGDTNFINGGDVGMLFRPAIVGFGYPESEGFELFSLFGDPIYAPMSLVDNTIGTTTFTGQSTFYVELDNEAFFAPGFPTILNGLDATFDGINPASTGGLLTPAQYAQIEAGIFHYVDRQDLGLFFFGFMSPGADINQKDIFRTFGGFNTPGNGLNITITGLPLIPGDLGSFFAGISPAAGDDDQGGNGADDLASIEPAAGGEELNCWADAVNTALGGATVNFSYSGSAEDLLKNQAGCQSGEL